MKKVFVLTDENGQGDPLSVTLGKHASPFRSEWVDQLTLVYSTIRDNGVPVSVVLTPTCDEVTFKRYSDVCLATITRGGKQDRALKVDGEMYTLTSPFSFNGLRADETVVFVPHSIPLHLCAYTQEQLGSDLLRETRLGDLIGPASQEHQTRYSGSPLWETYWGIATSG